MPKLKYHLALVLAILLGATVLILALSSPTSEVIIEERIIVEERIVTATPSPVEPEPFTMPIAERDIELLAQLLHYETGGMADWAKTETGYHIIEVVMQRTTQEFMSHGSIESTLDWGCEPGEQPQFVCAVTRGCPENASSSCVEDWSLVDLSHEYNVIENYFRIEHDYFYRAVFYDSVADPNPANPDLCRFMGCPDPDRHEAFFQDGLGFWVGFYSDQFSEKPSATTCEWIEPDGIDMRCPSTNCDIHGGFSYEHPGLDMSAVCNSPVVAAAGGSVSLVGFEASLGNFVVVCHDDNPNYCSWYAHLANKPYNLKVGDYLVAGEYIGAVGSTGNSTECHLHFEVRWHGNDPVVATGHGEHRNPLNSLCVGVK